MPIMNTGALLALVDGFAPAGTPDMGMVADPLTSHAEAGPEEVVSSLGSQPEGGRAFVRHTPQTRRTLRETPRRPLASSIRAICAVRWSEVATTYERRVRLTNRWRPGVVRHLRLRPGDHVLDVGCGTGANLPHLVAAVGASGHVTGIDLSEAMAAHARTR